MPQSTTASQRWSFLAIISLGLFMVGVDNSILFTALPTLRSELHTSELEGLWIINAYPLILASLLLGTGTLGDKIGHRRMFEIGLIIFGSASLAAAFSPTPLNLILARGLLGVGAATMMPATLALLRNTFHDVRERNIAIGIWGSVATIGAAAGPVIGGFLLEHYWWGSVFLINVPVVVIALVSTFVLAPKNHANPARHWDLISSVLAMIAMMGAVTLIKELAHQPVNFAMLGLATITMLIGGYAFSRRQAQLTEPQLTLDVFKNPLFSAGVLGAGLAMFVIAGVELTATQRFQLAVGFSPLEAGLVTATAAISAMPTSILGGATLHKLGFRPLISGGFILITLSMALAVYSTLADAFALLMCAMVGMGLGAGLVMSVTSTAIIGSAPKAKAGMASAIEEVSYEFGTLVSVAILGSILPMLFARFAPVGTSFNDALRIDAARVAFDNAFVATLILTGVVSAAAAIISIVLLKGNPKEPAYAHE